MKLSFIAVLLSWLCYCDASGFENSIQSAIWKHIDAEPESVCSTKLRELVNPSNAAALPFLDAMGKPISGALVGNLNWLGNYELCLDLKVAELLPCKTKGPVTLPSGGVGMLIWTSCLPLACKDEFLDIILDTATRYLNIIIQLNDLNITIPDINNTMFDTVCQEDIAYDAGAYVAITMCTLFLSMTIIGTLWAPLVHYITWVAAELGLSNPADQSGYNANKSCAEVGIVITNHSSSDANVMMDTVEMFNTPEDGVHTETLADNIYDNGQVLGCNDLASKSAVSHLSTDKDVANLLRARSGVAESGVTFLASLFGCFSLQKNIKILMDTTTKPGQILCMNGIRVLSIGWVVLSHMYLVPLLFNMGDGYQSYKISTRTSFDLILNGFPSVDSFFVMSGFLVSYLLIKNFNKGQSFGSMAFGYYIHRYIRLTVPYIMVILIEGFLYRQYVTGPSSDILSNGHNNCKEWWWTNLLYINNFVPWSNPSKCVGQTWYLANDMQFFMIAPAFIYLLWAKPVIGNLVCWGSILLSIVASGVATYVYDYGTTPLREGLLSSVFAYYYTKPYFRITPYLVGIYGGWFYGRYSSAITGVFSEKSMSNLIVAIPLWIITLAIEYGVVFGIHSESGLLPVDEEYSVTIPNAVLARIGWALALLVQIFLCQAGMGGPIGKFLSWRGWLPLSRLTYSVYLLHYGINIAWVAQLRHVFNFSPDIQTVIIFLGVVAMVNFASALLFLLVEQPAANLEKWLLTPAKKPAPDTTTVPKK